MCECRGRLSANQERLFLSLVHSHGVCVHPCLNRFYAQIFKSTFFLQIVDQIFQDILLRMDPSLFWHRVMNVYVHTTEIEIEKPWNHICVFYEKQNVFLEHKFPRHLRVLREV
jgi:hypothetical protein